MKAIHYMLFAAATLTLAACSKEENPDKPGAQVELRLTSALEVQTRAAHGLDTQLKEGETVHVWVDDAATDEPLYSNNTLTAGSDGALTGGETMYFPATGNNASIYAIHGNFAETTDYTNFWGAEQTHTVAQDQRTGQATDGYAQSDLVYSKLTDVSRNGNPTSINLTFKHLLSKMEVVLKQGAGSPTISKVEILNTQLEATFTPAKVDETVTVTASGTTGENPIEIDADLDGTTLNEAVIVPQTLKAGTEFIRITTAEGGQLIYSLPADKTFDPAKKYHYTITANLKGLDVKADISEWEEGKGESGDVTQPTHKDPDEAAVGDYLMKDGRVLGQENTLTPELASQVVGIVFHAGHHENDGSDYSATGIGQQKCHGYAVALQDATNGYCQWGFYGTELGCCPTDGSGNKQNNYSKPDIDWSGYAWTQKIITAAGGKEKLNATEESGYPATYYAVVDYETKVKAPANSSGWFLPSIGQMWNVYQNRTSLFDGKTGVSGLQSDRYWSSSENYYFRANSALYVSVSYGYVDSDFKHSRNSYVRPVLAF